MDNNTNLLIILGVATLILALIWLILRRKSARPRHHAPDALSEGAKPAQRNQALIDAPSSADVAKRS